MLQHVKDIILTDSLDELLAMGAQYPEHTLKAVSAYICILRCQKGRMQVELNDIRHQLNEGELLICLPQFLLGKYMRTPDFQANVLCVSNNFFHQIAIDCLRSEPKWLEKQQYVEEHPIITLDTFQSRLLESYLSLMADYLQCEQNNYRREIIRTLARAATLEIMYYLDSTVAMNAKSEVQPLGQKDQLLRNFVEMLRMPEYKQHEVQWYAQQLNVTPKYLSAVCKERSGKTASDWIDEFTMEEIRRKLIHTDMTTKEIGFQLGFSDTSYFCQYVKKKFGKTTYQIRSGK